MASEKETVAGATKQEEDPSDVEDDGGDVKSDEAGEKENVEEPEEDVNTEEKSEVKEESEEEADEGKGEDGEEEGDRIGEEYTEENEKKGSKRKMRSETAELKSPRTYGSERPTRERKMVERFKVHQTPRSSASKPFSIEKGQGTQLKEIPNVAFKLSKRKADENLQLLHTILYGKKAKVHTLKKNIGLFSGFVWAENEEKQKAKTKEKVVKCIKEKLLDFCDVLNISVNKASIKKEELVVKLLEFLESPHATTDTLLAEKEKGKKRKSKAPASKSSSSHVTGEKSTKRKGSTVEENDDKSEPSLGESDKDDEKSVPKAASDDEENDVEDQINEDEVEPKKKLIKKVSSKKITKKYAGKGAVNPNMASKGSPLESSKASNKSNRKSTGGVASRHAEYEQKSKVKSTSTKKQKVEKESENDTKGTSTGKKKLKSKAKISKNDQELIEDSESSDNEVKEPSREQLHAAVVDILKEVDFNTATLSDILKQLGKHFGVDLIHRKTEVKETITEVIKNMSDDEEDESGAEESGKDEDDD